MKLNDFWGVTNIHLDKLFLHFPDSWQHEKFVLRSVGAKVEVRNERGISSKAAHDIKLIQGGQKSTELSPKM